MTRLHMRVGALIVIWVMAVLVVFDVGEHSGMTTTSVFPLVLIALSTAAWFGNREN